MPANSHPLPIFIVLHNSATGSASALHTFTFVAGKYHLQVYESKA